MKVLVDTNVLLDVAFKRLPHYTDSKLVNACGASIIRAVGWSPGIRSQMPITS